MFVVIEGLDGSGKSTQMNLIKNKFNALGHEAMITFEPSDGPVGSMARHVIDGGFKLENETIALLIAADRYQHVHDVIKPALDAGVHVICDRYYYSSLVYQGRNHDEFLRVAEYNGCVMNDMKPDVVIYLDVLPEECMRRLNESRNNLSIYEDAAQLEQQRQKYFEVFDALSARENIIIIDATHASIETIIEKIWAALMPFL